MVMYLSCMSGAVLSARSRYKSIDVRSLEKDKT